MPPKRPRRIKQTESERIRKLFEEASEDSSDPETVSSNDLQESEQSSDEHEGQFSGGGMHASSSTLHDPFSDGDGEYGSDMDYNPNNDKSAVSDNDSERTRSDIVLESRTNNEPKNVSTLSHDAILRDSPSVIQQVEHETNPGSSSSQATQIDSTNGIPLQNYDVSMNATDIIIEIEQLIQQVEEDNGLVSSPGLTTTQAASSADVFFGRNHEEPMSHQPNTTNPRATSPVIEDDVWEETTKPIPKFSFDSSDVGPSVPLNSDKTPENVLEMFLDNEMLEYIVKCTNAYGAALCNVERPHTRGSRKQAFKPTDVTEMKKFLGLCMLQGHISAPSIRKYFTQTDPLYYHPVFPFVMSGRRFEQLLRCLCISEGNSKGTEKVNYFAKQVIDRFRNNNKPDKYLSLDESLMAFRGRLSFRQYIKGKKAKYGIKFYVLTTHDGYILNFIMYEGKDTETLTPNPENVPKLKALVMKLMQPYLDKGHELYMDNFYNSADLSKSLLQHKTHTTGTLRKDRKDNPKEIFQKNLKKGEHYWRRKGLVYASVWKDKRPVFMVSTLHHPQMSAHLNRFGKIIMKPIEVVEYNKFMKGVDKSDQMMAYYSTPKKTIRWYKKVFFHLFDMTLWNSFYLFRKHCDSKSHFLSFRESIMQTYLQMNEDTQTQMILESRKSCKSLMKKRTPQPTRPAAEEEEPGHWPELIPPTEKTKANNKYFLKCRVCTKNKKVKQTSYRCPDCVEKPALCPQCFKEWHKK